MIIYKLSRLADISGLTIHQVLSALKNTLSTSDIANFESGDIYAMSITRDQLVQCFADNPSGYLTRKVSSQLLIGG
jgi:hypothetical protein